MRLSPALLSVLVVAACARAPIIAPPPEPPVGPPVDFAGTGQMPCSVGEPIYDEVCPFEISRGAGGTVALRVQNPAADAETGPRVLLFQNGVWMTIDGSILESEREAATTFVAVDELEFYAVPHDVLTGEAVAED